jgi:hypothetical protein
MLLLQVSLHQEIGAHAMAAAGGAAECAALFRRTLDVVAARATWGG